MMRFSKAWPRRCASSSITRSDSISASMCTLDCAAICRHSSTTTRNTLSSDLRSARRAAVADRCHGVGERLPRLVAADGDVGSENVLELAADEIARGAIDAHDRAVHPRDEDRQRDRVERLRPLVAFLFDDLLQLAPGDETAECFSGTAQRLLPPVADRTDRARRHFQHADDAL